MSDPNDTRFMSEWLASDAGRAVLDRLVPAVFRQARARRLSLRFLGLELDWRDIHSGKFLEDDLRSELARFLLEKATPIRRALTAGENNPAAYLKMAFLNHWIDRTRKREADVHRFMRKRVLDVLQAAPGFYVFTEKGSPTRFSRDPAGRPLPPLATEDLDEIEFPSGWEGGRDLDSLNTGDALRILAHHFYETVSTLWGGAGVQVDLSDFLRWFFRHADTGAPVSVDAPPDSLPDSRPPVNPSPADEKLIRQWATCCAQRLSDNEKAAVYYRYWTRSTLEKIAEKLGYKSPGSADNQVASAERKMKTFLRELPDLSPEDLDETAFRLFMDALQDVLKKSIPTP
ncbi:MAG: hypothetical protein ACOC3A_00915 [Thermodesulfobacteriota bacterium]